MQQLPPRTNSLRQLLTLLLLALGIQTWIVLGRAQTGEKRQVFAAVVAVIIGVILGTRPTALAWYDRLRQPTPRTKLLCSITITLLAAIYLYAAAKLQHRDLAPILHDEHVYAIQSKMLAAGKLWLPRHDRAEFFDSFHLITDRVYASKYGPGAAIFFAPAALLGLPIWLTPLLLSALAVGLTYLLMTELFDGIAGWLGALLLLSLGIFRRTSTMAMSQAPMLVLILLAMLAFLMWRRDRRLRWIALLGACLGWGAITRPVDALCVALPLALAVFLDLLRRAPHAGSCGTGFPRHAGSFLKPLAVGLAAILPFLALQLLYNKGVTGNFTQMPWAHYGKLYDPYDTMGRVKNATAFTSTTPQKQALIEEFTRPAYERREGTPRLHRLIDRAARTLAGPELREQPDRQRVYGALPTPLLIGLLPVGLLALADRKRWALWGALPPFLLIYAQYTFFLPHYAVAIAPAVIINLLAAIPAIQSTWPQSRWISPALACVVAILALTALPELNPSRKDQWFEAPLLRDVDAKLANLPQTPAVVLFKFDPERMIHEEPVYNLQTANPDDAPVIRAHDLGDPANRRLFAYYAARHPDRAVYRYDEATGNLTHLGSARDLAK